MIVFKPLTQEEQETIKVVLAPLPLSGEAWAKWVRWLVLMIGVFIGLELVLTVQKVGIAPLNNIAGLTILLVFVALLVMVYYMFTSTTRIGHEGLHQTWISRREVKWDEITFVKFVPLLASKRIIVFLKQGRPVTFHAGTKPLQIAFAKLSLQFQHRH